MPRHLRRPRLNPRRLSVALGTSTPRLVAGLSLVLVGATGLAWSVLSGNAYDAAAAERASFAVSGVLQPDTLTAQITENTLVEPVVNAGGPAEATPTEATSHVVTGGENLVSIALAYGLANGQLTAANPGINPSLIKPGQVLTIPVPDPSYVPPKDLFKDEEPVVASAGTKAKTGTKTVTAASIGSSFNPVSPMSYRQRSQGFHKSHPGVDFAGPIGTPVRAAEAGCFAVVDGVGWNGGYGKTLVLTHGSGYSTRYAHLSGFADVAEVGVCVERGQTIGYNGNTGRSTGPHLHFEIRRNGVAINPATFGF